MRNNITSEHDRLKEFQAQQARIRQLVLLEGQEATCTGYPCPHILGAYKKIAELEQQVTTGNGNEINTQGGQ